MITNELPMIPSLGDPKDRKGKSFQYIEQLICSNKNCNYKTTKPFNKGDYVFKSVGNCAKCNSKLIIESIAEYEVKK